MRAKAEEELTRVTMLIGQRRRELSVISKARDTSEGDEFNRLSACMEMLRKEIVSLSKKKERLEETANGFKALAMAGIDGPPTNKEEVVFLFGFLAKGMNFDCVSIDNNYGFTAIMDGKTVRGVIERYGKGCEGITICWKKSKDALPDRTYIELERYLYTC